MTRIPIPAPLFLFLFLLISLLSCERKSSSSFFRNSDFNEGWEFHMGDIQDPFESSGSVVNWIRVQLPHDWSIMDYEIQDSLHQGPFYKDLPGGADVAYLRNGTAWYRKEFVSPANGENSQILLSFDGVQSQMGLWVNGELMGEHVYGYTPFQFDITPALKKAGEKNIIAVKTVNPGENSRWFAGAGIYRSVTISMLHPVSLAPWGVYITTPQVSRDQASVHFEIEVSNQLDSEVEVNGEIRLLSPDKRQITLNTEKVTAGEDTKLTLTASTQILNPMLWSIDQPGLYRAEVILYAGGDEVDSYQTAFGIRSITYNVEKGFLLNGEEILMKGACMHHDNGLLGAAAFRDAEYRRVKRMKENGYNAIRTSHNPPSEDFLNACDELGMLVIDEAFDHWLKPKRPNDYSNYFEEWHLRDIQAMVYRDRNHPAVVMWSFGNEVQERADPEGIEIGKALAAAIREVDDTRPVTQAVCGFWDNPGKEWDYSAGAFSMQDIGGYNYQFQQYESDHIKYPDRLMYGAESVAQNAWDNWELVKRHPYVIGDFVWTGMDYMGESGIGHTRLVEKGSEPRGNFLKPWPWYISWCGDLDILGNKKSQSHYRDILWGESRLELMISTPIPEGKESRLSFWGWYDEERHWNWEGHEGKLMHVKAYSSYPAVKLELNGKVVGVSNIDSLDKFVAQFSIPFEPGELRAIGIQEGKEMETVSLKTAAVATHLRLIAEQKTMDAHSNALVFINVSARDQAGLLSPVNDAEVQVRVSGPAQLQAGGNANPTHQGSFTDETFKLFRGRGLLIIRSTGEPGTITVEVSSGGLEPSSVTVEAT